MISKLHTRHPLHGAWIEVNYKRVRGTISIVSVIFHGYDILDQLSADEITVLEMQCRRNR